MHSTSVLSAQPTQYIHTQSSIPIILSIPCTSLRCFPLSMTTNLRPEEIPIIRDLLKIVLITTDG